MSYHNRVIMYLLKCILHILVVSAVKMEPSYFHDYGSFNSWKNFAFDRCMCMRWHLFHWQHVVSPIFMYENGTLPHHAWNKCSGFSMFWSLIIFNLSEQWRHFKKRCSKVYAKMQSFEFQPTAHKRIKGNLTFMQPVTNVRNTSKTEKRNKSTKTDIRCKI